MMPISDDNSLRKTLPIVTYCLIALNVLFYFFEMAGGEEFIMRWAFVPSRFLSDPYADSSTIFTSMFMHAGIAHLVGNMLYLWIFGDNVEDSIGKTPFLIFYFVCGISAIFSQMLFNPESTVPNVGASGAIAGVLGAYIYLFPHGKINVILGRSMQMMPAYIVIGFWFVLQFISGVGSTAHLEGSGGVAYMAHIGGFLMGLVIMFFYQKINPANR